MVTHAAASKAASGTMELPSPVELSSPPPSSPVLPLLDPEVLPLVDPDELLPLLDPEVLPLDDPEPLPLEECPELLPELDPELLPLPLLDVEFPPFELSLLHPVALALSANAPQATTPPSKPQRELNFI